MIFQQRHPSPPLSRFVELLWFYQDLMVDHSKEKLLPNGAIELIIDLSSSPKKLYDPSDLTRFKTFRGAWISGMQRRYIIAAERGSSMMGIHFRPGGAAPFFNLRSHDRHCALRTSPLPGFASARTRRQSEANDLSF